MEVFGIYRPDGHLVEGSVRDSRKRARRDFATLHGCRWGDLWGRGYRVGVIRGTGRKRPEGQGMSQEAINRRRSKALYELSRERVAGRATPEEGLGEIPEQPLFVRPLPGRVLGWVLTPLAAHWKPISAIVSLGLTFWMIADMLLKGSAPPYATASYVLFFGALAFWYGQLSRE